MLSCTIGITAFNEAQNIGHLLARLRDQTLETVALDEILVVASGCTDDTESIVRDCAKRDSRIRLLVQPQREGKASALNLIVQQARNDLIVICSADLLPAHDAVEQLVRPLANPNVGMTGCRPVPVNDKTTFMGYAVHLQWELHHQISLRRCKAGEMIAFRRIFERIPPSTAVDEASIEPLIRGQGYDVVYAAQALVYNKGPETVRDFLRQRRRIYAGHLAMKETLGYSVSTLSAGVILPLLLRQLEWRPRPVVWTAAVIALESVGRWLGKRDYRKQRDHSVWEIATTTKRINIPS